MEKISQMMISTGSIELVRNLAIGFFVCNIIAILFLSSMPIWGILGMTGMLSALLLLDWQYGNIIKD